MSRCFPFPPPGYEKKPRSEEGDLLKEEKRKEKKQKKEKKDKEKREGKEKKDKDKSDGKHREKKEKKDKHTDKKEKHKDKKDNKDKEKNSIPDDAVLPGPSNGGKLHEKEEHKGRHISSEKGERLNHGRPNQFSAVEAEDSKFVQELGRRIRDDEKGARSQLPERSPVEWKKDEKMDRVGIKDSGNLVEVKGKNKERGIYNSKMDGQVFRAELKIGANTIPPSLSATAKSNFEGTSRLLEENVEKTRVGIKDSGNLVEVKGKNKEKGINNNRMDGQVFRGELKIGAHAIPPSLFRTASKFEGISRPLGENVEKTREEKKKSKERRDDKPREKNKDKEREKQSHGKQKDKEKEKKKEEKAKDKSGQKKIQEDKSSDTNTNNSVVLSNNKLPLVSKENIGGTVTEGIVREGIVRKRDLEANGFQHESEIRPAKLPRPSSSQQPIQNEQILDPYPKADLFSSSKQEVAADIKLQKKEHKANGRVEDQTLPNTKAKASLPVIPGADQIAESSKAKASLSMIPAVDKIAESSKRPPHPDSKYLSQILSVPKTEDWSGFDDQEWLWASKRSPVKKAKTCPGEVNKEYCVWSEALQIDSADVCALPYVIPY